MSRSSSRGFSLVEVMIAMAVLATGMIATGPLVHYAISRATEGRKVTAAQLLGTEIIERLRTEVRYDAEPASGTLGTYAFTLADAWKADRLPYSTQDTVNTGAAGALTTCNPAGASDATTYKVGPFRAQYEAQQFYVCYDLVAAPAAVAAPGTSVNATVKVLWPTANGWSARWLTSVLLDGR